MSSPRTFTHTWAQTRLETLQDQFRYLLQYGGIKDDTIEKVLKGVADKTIAAVGVYGKDNSGARVVEVELRVDWGRHAELTLTVPTIHGGLPGWLDRQSPEVRVAGRRLATIIENQGLTVGWWIELAQAIRSDPPAKTKWEQHFSISGSAPKWKGGGYDERSERLIDMDEAETTIRRSK